MSLASSAFAVGNYANNNLADGMDYIGLFGYLEEVYEAIQREKNETAHAPSRNPKYLVLSFTLDVC